MKLCTGTDATGNPCMGLLDDAAGTLCRYCDPGHAPNPRAGTIIDCDGIEVQRGMLGHRYPITAKCATCYRLIGCADGTADWVHMDERYARYFAMIPETSAVR